MELETKPDIAPIAKMEIVKERWCTWWPRGGTKRNVLAFICSETLKTYVVLAHGIYVQEFIKKGDKVVYLWLWK